MYGFPCFNMLPYELIALEGAVHKGLSRMFPDFNKAGNVEYVLMYGG